MGNEPHDPQKRPAGLFFIIIFSDEEPVEIRRRKKKAQTAKPKETLTVAHTKAASDDKSSSQGPPKKGKGPTKKQSRKFVNKNYELFSEQFHISSFNPLFSKIMSCNKYFLDFLKC